MLKLFFLLVILQKFVTCEDFVGCEKGWVKYENTKCVYSFNFESTYEESETYCEKQFGANILNITDENERMFWSFQLVRLSNLSLNIWLQKPHSLKNTDQCLTLRSKYSKDDHKIGAIIQQNCESYGTTVCEIGLNQKLKTNEPAKEYDPNESMVPNRQIKYSNGNLSGFFTGVYYAITSKYKNSPFSNSILGNGKCSVNDEKHGCSTMYHDKDFDDKFGNFYMFTSDNGQQVQIRRFNSEKLLVNEPDKYLSNFNCGKGTLTASGRKFCEIFLKDYKANDKWELTQFNNSEYFLIKSTTNNYTLGAKIFEDGKNGTLGYGLYDPVDEKSSVDDKLLFKIEPFYTFNVEISSLSFDKSLEDVVKSNQQQITIIDTEVINNNSPATLEHLVSNTKEVTESFSATYGISQSFMDSLSRMEEISKTFSDTNSETKSFTDTTSHEISSSLFRTVTDSQSTTDSSFESDSHNEDSSFHVGITIPIEPGVGVTLGVGANFGHGTGSRKSNSQTSINKNKDTNRNENTDQNSNSNTHGDSHNHIDNNKHQANNKTTVQKSNSTVHKIDQSIVSTRTYSIHKTVSLPPYSAVKITSYANWINDLKIPFNMTLKFTVQSFRRSIDGSELNIWRTMDSNFVKHLLKGYLFNGNINKESFDIVYGEVWGDLKASIGLDSVFVAKEIKLDQQDTLK